MYIIGVLNSQFDFSLFPQGKAIKGAYKFHAIITTFEMILTDCPELRSVPWRCVIIDEAHRLKNRNCKLLEGLKMMDMVNGPFYFQENSPSNTHTGQYV